MIDSNVVIVGTGPGGIIATKILAELRPDLNILLIDKGSHKRNICPALYANKTCKGCGGICRIISGAGGACSEVSCGLLSKHPAGSGLEKYIPLTRLKNIERKIIGWMENVVGDSLELVSPKIHRDIKKKLSTVSIMTKEYASYEILGKDFSNLISKLMQDLYSHPNVAIHFNSELKKIDLKNDKYILHLNASQKIRTNRLIISTGRAGSNNIVEQLKKIGVMLTGYSGYLGIRFEDKVSNQLISLRKQVADPKFIRNGTRIFCFCPKGKVVGMRTSVKNNCRLSFIDSTEGCVEPLSEFGNFSIQKKITFDSSYTYNCFNENFENNYRGLSNGVLVGQSLASLTSGGKALSFPSSVSKRFIVKPIRRLFDNCKISYRFLDDSLKFLYDLNTCFQNDIISEKAGILAPELHIWPQFALKKGFETNVAGCHIIGDVGGIARGIMQAGVGGFEAAEHIANSL